MAKDSRFGKFGAMLGLGYLVIAWMGLLIFGTSLLTAELTGQRWLQDYGQLQVYGYFSAFAVLTILGTLACFALMIVVDNARRKPDFANKYRMRLVAGVAVVIILLSYFAYQCYRDDPQFIFMGLLIAHLPLLIPAIIAVKSIRKASRMDFAPTPESLAAAA